MSNDKPCTGNWLGLHGEFGRVINPICVNCQRPRVRFHDKDWMTVKVIMDDKCDYKIVSNYSDTQHLSKNATSKTLSAHTL